MTPRIVLFDLYAEGHHPQYLESLLRYWSERELPGALHLVVSNESAHRNPELVELASTTERATLHEAEVPPRFALVDAGMRTTEQVNRRVARHYAERLRADHLLLMSFDTVQLSVALDLRFSWPLALAGIYFRPSFHYGGTRSARERATTLAKSAVVRAALRNPHLATLFSLDPTAVPGLARWANHTKCVFLPEPLWDPPRELRGTILTAQVERGRRRLVIFGSLDKRKGLPVVLEALAELPTSVQSQLALVLAGRLNEAERLELESLMGAFRARSAVQLVANDEHVPEAEIQPLLRDCDLVLVTYPRHTGSSGLLVRAAAAGTPVLASEFGLVGQQVRRHRLGRTIDSSSPPGIRAALEEWVERRETIPFDAASAETFARANTTEAFAGTIFEHVVGVPTGADDATSA